MPTPARFAALPVALSLRCASIDPLWQRLSRYRWHFPCNRSWHATDAAVMSKWVLGAADRATWRVVWSATLCGSQLRLRPSCLPPRADVRAMARIQHSPRCWHANLSVHEQEWSMGLRTSPSPPIPPSSSSPLAPSPPSPPTPLSPANPAAAMAASIVAALTAAVWATTIAAAARHLRRPRTQPRPECECTSS